MIFQHETSRFDLDGQSTSDDAAEVTVDCRRPGRPDSVSPALIPLLRGDWIQDASLNEDIDLADEWTVLAPAVGIAVSVVLSLPLWAIVGLTSWAVTG